MAAAEQEFTEQISGILETAGVEAATAGPTALRAHKVWVEKIVNVLHLAREGSALRLPEDLQGDTTRLLLALCGFEEEADCFRLPSSAFNDVELAETVVQEYLLTLADSAECDHQSTEAVVKKLGTAGEESCNADPSEAESARKDIDTTCSSGLPPAMQPSMEETEAAKGAEGTAASDDKLSDAALAEALARSFQEEEDRKCRIRPGRRLLPSELVSLGAAFERQPEGSDSCAIHSLNNLVQPKRSPDEAGQLLAAATAAAAQDEQFDDRAKEFWDSMMGLIGPFSLATLQQADAEARCEEVGQSSFLPTATHLSLLRADSGYVSTPTASPAHRTGMFDVEAVKLAARSKGFEVIDVEPKPTWADSDVARYVAAAREISASGSCETWFRGFLVYERMPGRAMHYYSILYWPGEKPSQESWIVLDSCDRGENSPRNRLLSLEEVTALHDENAEFFRSWLLRWYPVVDRRAAVDCLKWKLKKAVQTACEGIGTMVAEEQISVDRAEAVLDASQVRWDVALAADELLAAPHLVGRELQVLQLTLSEHEARQELEHAAWDFERAVRLHAERLLERLASAKTAAERSDLELEKVICSTLATRKDLDKNDDASEGVQKTGLEGKIEAQTYVALCLMDWDVHTAAQLLLLASRAAELPSDQPTSSTARLRSAAAALKESSFDLHRALLTLQLAEAPDAVSNGGDGKDSAQESDSATERAVENAARLLRHSGFDLSSAKSLADVKRRFPQAPLVVCAEALRRGDGQASAAVMLLSEFQERLSGFVKAVAKKVSRPLKVGGGYSGFSSSDSERAEAAQLSDEDVKEVSRLALEAADWNPDLAFCSAESFVLGLIQVRRELAVLEKRARLRAMTIVHAREDEQDKTMAAALAALDALEALQEPANLAPDAMLAALQECDMAPVTAAACIFFRCTGLHPEGGKKLPPPPPRPPSMQKQLQGPGKAMPGRSRSPAVKPGVPASSRSSTTSKPRRRDDCSTM
eukprot:TRINITY_DN23818_c0_g1_i1.p1 TRINITY_DN23818_c0_g1~~TRINITY_DN23818_c0_g1_i1.p1  ORF type:complete len:996 (+),score=291.71 TRINITY_DN23818_c0_g1_i1:22-2988(+)